MLTKRQLSSSNFFIVFVAGLAALAPFAVDMYLPTLPDMARTFQVDIAAANLTISAFLVGMGLGQFVGGPLSDQLGRKTIGVTGLVIFTLASLLIIFADSILQVQILRVCQAIGGGFASVVCMAQARDVYPRELVIKKYANIIMVVLIAPMIAPTIGAMLAGFGWRMIFWVLIAYAVLMIVLYLSLMPETMLPHNGQFKFSKLFRGYQAAITNRTDGRLIALRMALFTGFSSGILFSYVINASFIFIDHFGLSTFQFALVFGLMASMLMIGNRLSAWRLDRTEAKTLIVWANLMQLLALIGIVLLCVLSEPSLWQIMLGLGLLITSNGAISPIASGYYISLFTENVGSASSLNSSIMFVFGAAIGGLGAVFSNGQLLPVFIVMLCSSIIARGLLWSAR